MKKNEVIIAVLILLGAFIARIYTNISAPLVDYHSSQQASTMSVARSFQENGIDLIYPRHNDRYNYQYGVENPEQYYFYEFPLYSAVVAVAGYFSPQTPLEVIGRIVTIISSLVCIGILFYLVRTWYGLPAAIGSSVVFSFFPFFVYFSRSALSDMFAVSIYMIALFFSLLFSLSKKRIQILWYILMASFFSLSVLLKPALFFFIIPIFALFFKKTGLKGIKHYSIYMFAILSTVPVLLWFRHISQYSPEGIPFSYLKTGDPTTFSYLDTLIPSATFLTDVLYTHVITSVLGGLLGMYVFMSMIIRSKQHILYTFLVSVFLYLLVFQMKHTEYEFYQVLILPWLALSVGVGAVHLFYIKNKQPILISVTLLVMSSLYAWYISFNQAWYYFQTSDDQVQVAKVIQTLTDPEEEIITDTDGNTTLLYLSDRTGASSAYAPPDELKQKGYSYVFTQKIDRIDQYKNEYELEPIFENDKFSLFRI
jgi:4-amino-4-deoxy-L-arabinose transferase-like glycosyltransferase